MLKRTYLGLEIRQRALHAVAVQKKGKTLLLSGGKSLRLDEGVIRPGFSAANVLEPGQCVDALKSLLGPLVRGDNRVSVALPDNSGRLFLLDVETPFKNQTEGAEIVRWQLKDLIPGQTSRLSVDYQLLEERDSGLKRVLVAAMETEVLKQYEAVVEQAGFAAAVVDFHSQALYNAYRSKVDFGHDFIFVGVDGCQLGIQVFTNRTPVFHRARVVERDPQQIFQEINRSLVGPRSQISNLDRMPVYLHSDWVVEELSEVVAGAFDQQIQFLTSPVKKLINGHQMNFADVDAHSLATALGAAERMIKGVA